MAARGQLWAALQTTASLSPGVAIFTDDRRANEVACPCRNAGANMTGRMQLNRSAWAARPMAALARGETEAVGTGNPMASCDGCRGVLIDDTSGCEPRVWARRTCERAVPAHRNHATVGSWTEGMMSRTVDSSAGTLRAPARGAFGKWMEPFWSSF